MLVNNAIDAVRASPHPTGCRMIDSPKKQRSMNALVLLITFLLTLPAQAEPFAVAQVPYYQMADGEKRVLAERVAKIKEGDSYEAVIQELGEPSMNQPLVSKKSNRLIGKSLKYYAVIWEKGLVNELNDELVDIVLDESNRVTSVYVRLKLID